MKRNIPAFLSGTLTTALVGTIAVSAFAVSGRMTIEVDPINVQVNGEVFQPKDANGNAVPVFSYNGTTYAPLRALAEAYGLEVGYDAGSNMATVAGPERKPENVATVPEPTGTPAPALSEEWTDTDEAFYKQLTEGFEFTLIAEVPGGGGGVDTAAYNAEYLSGEFAFDWDTFEKSDSFEKVVRKIGETVNKTKQTNFGVWYGDGHTIFLYDGWAHM